MAKRKPLNPDKLDKILGKATELVKLAELRRDGATQPRASMDDETIAEYSERMTRRSDGIVIDLDGVPWAEIVVFFDGENYWLADGFHRSEAAVQLKIRQFQADLRQGTRRDAFVFSLGANAKHGLPRSNADKRRVVRQALWDEELKVLSDRQVGEICGVSQPFVSKLRKELKKADDYVPPSYRVGADGKKYDTKKVTGRESRENDSQVGVVKRRTNGKTSTLAGGTQTQQIGSISWLEGDFRQHLKSVSGADILFTQELDDVSDWDALAQVAATALTKDGLFICMHDLDDMQDICTVLGRRKFGLLWCGVIRWMPKASPVLTEVSIWTRGGAAVPDLHEFWELTRDFGGRQFFARELLKAISEPGDVIIDPRAGAYVAPITISAAALGLTVTAIDSSRAALKEAKRMAGNLLGGT